MDLDEESIISQLHSSTKAKAPPKKQSRSKARKGSKKADNVTADMDVEEVETSKKTKRSTRGKKRLSDLVNDEEEEAERESPVQEGERPVKRRTTKSRAQSQDVDMEDVSTGTDDHIQEKKPKRNRGSKKNSSARNDPRVPRDSELDRALEADLDMVEQTGPHSKKGKEPEAVVSEEPASDNERGHGHKEGEMEVEVETVAKKTKSGKAGNREARKTSPKDPSTRSSSQDDVSSSRKAGLERHDHDVSVEIVINDQPESKRPSANKKDQAEEEFAGRTAEKTGRGTSEHDHDLAEPEANVHRKQAQHRSFRGPPKTVERYSDLPQDQHFADSVARSPLSTISHRIEEAHVYADQAEAVSPFPTSSGESAASSPKSSDVENHAPSTKTSKLSAAPSNQVLSTTEEKRVPLAPGTPSSSKQNANTRLLQTSHPWMPVDIENIIFSDLSDKEKGSADEIDHKRLSSPEKRMTVDEWISWNAKNGEDKLKQECERLVSQFEREGGRALRCLQGIECID